MRIKNSLFGILLLLLAGFIIANQFGWLEQFNLRTFITAAFALMFLLHCITNKTISTLPFAAALGYLVLRNLDIVPYVSTWAIILAAWFIYIAFSLIFPKRKKRKNKYFSWSFSGNNGMRNDDIIDEKLSKNDKRREKAFAKMGSLDDNPTVSVAFSGTSRYLQADNLQTVSLSCLFGGMDIYLDQAQLSETGAVVDLDCKFGGIDIYVPRHWVINEQIRCVFGGADVNGRSAKHDENSPKITITGNVMFGGVDINYI